MKTSKWFVIAVAVLALAGATANATTDDKIERVLLIGDSWAHFMWFDHAMSDVMTERGLGHYSEENAALGGTKASQWGVVGGINNTAFFQLQNFPSIDTIFVTLGGDDIMYGEPMNWFEFVEVNGIENEGVFFNQIADGIVVCVQQYLDYRPDMRVVVCGYDYMNAIKKANALDGKEVCDLTPAEALARNQYVNAIMVRCEQVIADHLKAMDRVYFVNNYGVLHHYLGYPGPNPPAWLAPWEGECKHNPRWDPTGFDQTNAFAPGAYPLPGQKDTNYVPFEGGNPALKRSAWESMLYWDGQWIEEYNVTPAMADQLGLVHGPVDDWIHLSDEGHNIIIRNCMDVVLEEWLRQPLSNPKVIESRCLDTALDKDRQARFLVKFDRMVKGIDESDFVPAGAAGEGATIVDVVAEGDTKTEYAYKFVVTVQVASGKSGDLQLNVYDDDSIRDEGNKPLGGNGSGNGTFTSGTALNVEGVPLAAWPAVLLLGLAGMARLRRR